MSEATQKAKSNIIYKNSMAKNFEMGEEKAKYASARSVAEFRGEIKICIERAHLYTGSFKETEGKPMVLRRAMALRNILENMTIYILDGERIVGNFASNPWSLPLYPELIHRWIDQGVDDGLRDMLEEKDREEYFKISQYWEGKSIDDITRDAVPEEAKDYIDWNGACYTTHYNTDRGTTAPNYKRIFELGLKGVRREAEDRLRRLRKGMPQEMMSKPDEYLEQKDFLEAVIISLDAVIKFSNRYADLARGLAKDEKDGKRKEELEEIARICSWVPENPARTLHEALQFYFFVHLISRAIENHGQAEGSRFDQYMNPYYQRDLKEGRITKDQAQELLEFLWIKMDEFGLLEPPELHGLQSGGTWYQTMNLGGMTKDGDDATNDMSFLMLDATESIRTLQPTFALRYHPKINPGIVYRTIDLLRTGIGFPAIFNDSTIIPFITNRGIPLEDAREYGIYACVLWSIPGKNMRKFPNPGCLSAGKCLMLALYQGMDKFTGKQIGCMTPDASSFSCIEDVLDAYGKQVEFVFDKMAKIDNIGRSLYRRYLQRPFTSALFDGCIEKGKDMTAWTYHAYNPTLVAGTVNVVDSLAAIKKFVFDDKILTMKELVEACENNFEGREDLRQRLINEAPKFGNDDDYVDSLAREVYIRTSKEVAKSKDLYGASWCIDGSLGGGHYSIGRGCGATPDGRKDNEAFADATLSPMAGMDKNGPTAVIKSTSKIDPLMTQTLLLNQKFLPQFLEGENKKVFADYLKTWADLGHWHVQFNVVSKGTLLDAQQRPEDYSDLIVRVAGYSAYFVDLSKGVQDDIIARTEQRF